MNRSPEIGTTPEREPDVPNKLYTPECEGFCLNLRQALDRAAKEHRLSTKPLLTGTLARAIQLEQLYILYPDLAPTLSQTAHTIYGGRYGRDVPIWEPDFVLPGLGPDDLKSVTRSLPGYTHLGYGVETLYAPELTSVYSTGRYARKPNPQNAMAATVNINRSPFEKSEDGLPKHPNLKPSPPLNVYDKNEMPPSADPTFLYKFTIVEILRQAQQAESLGRTVTVSLQDAQNFEFDTAYRKALGLPLDSRHTQVEQIIDQAKASDRITPNWRQMTWKQNRRSALPNRSPLYFATVSVMHRVLPPEVRDRMTSPKESMVALLADERLGSKLLWNTVKLAFETKNSAVN